MREVQEQFCPEPASRPMPPIMIALSRLASSNMISGDLPPSSSVRRLRLPAAALTISRPTSVDPVNEILSTSGWAVSAAPVVSP